MTEVLWSAKHRHWGRQDPMWGWLVELMWWDEYVEPKGRTAREVSVWFEVGR